MGGRHRAKNTRRDAVDKTQKSREHPDTVEKSAPDERPTENTGEPSEDH